MALLAHSYDIADRRAPVGRGDIVHGTYWIVLVLLTAALVFGVPLDHPSGTRFATLLFILGGLPHGAYDIALLQRAVALDRRTLWMVVAGYIAVALAMALLWMTVPLIALILFLSVAATHFGEDWPMLEEPLLRFAAGAAVIAAATIGHRADVTALFVDMSDDRGLVIAQVIAAAAPVILLVTAVGIAIAWHDGSRQWAAAMTSCLLLLWALPPVVGFALFFVFLHSPRHLTQARVTLGDMTRLRWLAVGAALSTAAIIGWWALHAAFPWRIGGAMTTQAFQLLASVAVPHLLLSRWLDHWLDRSGAP
ncbi:MAG TPA: Brp/Blh family beta-carotene 15,15'-dioxygenase [Sphingomonas sp.]|uniref:Brp/Blh family beta-carotene 15,15'-dioxygenase n=1 Tax=Sphingomonas sp. TaxID=28214 RepID=UPI002ED7FD00